MVRKLCLMRPKNVTRKISGGNLNTSDQETSPNWPRLSPKNSPKKFIRFFFPKLFDNIQSPQSKRPNCKKVQNFQLFCSILILTTKS